MCTELLPPGSYPIAVKYAYLIKYGISTPLRLVTWTRIKLKNENELNKCSVMYILTVMSLKQ
jgi:hypothetical protein